MDSFEGKVAMVTGAGSGIGRALAIELAERGAILALNSFTPESLQDTVDLLPPDTIVMSRAYDVSDRAEAYRFAADVSEELGDAHVVINNAGIEGSAKPVWATGDEVIERVMEVNYLGVVYGTKAFLPHLIRNETGAIANISSIFGLVGAPNGADYCASKFAVRGFTESLVAELRDTDISVHLIHPGGIATNFARQEESRAFSDKYLTTTAEEMADVVLDAIIDGRARVVHGNSALRTALAARFLPLKVLAWMVRRDVDDVMDHSDYPPAVH